MKGEKKGDDKHDFGSKVHEEYKQYKFVKLKDLGKNEFHFIPLNIPKFNRTRHPNNKIITSKYTLISFLPKNLWEQFRRLSNFYFLAVAVVQMFPIISPFIPYTSILPLGFVLTLTAIKDGYEDFIRHREDKHLNKILYNCIQDGEIKYKHSKHIHAGDILKIYNYQTLPADIIVLSASTKSGICYIQTSNLDGETNLKQRKSLMITQGLNTPEYLSRVQGGFCCQLPGPDIYNFTAQLELLVTDQVEHLLAISSREDVVDNILLAPVETTNFLPRGSQLRNTKFVYGICVYTGRETKLALNQRVPPSKFSTVEKKLNKIFLSIFSFQMALCLLAVIMSVIFKEKNDANFWYLDFLIDSSITYSLINFLTYFILFNIMIPISLWVTLEFQRFFQGYFMENDNQMKVCLGLDIPSSSPGVNSCLEEEKEEKEGESSGEIIHELAPSEGDQDFDSDFSSEISSGEEHEKNVPQPLLRHLSKHLSTLSQQSKLDADSQRKFLPLNGLPEEELAFHKKHGHLIYGPGCQAHTTGINEDLGRIQHLFCDKTGTLTENILKFKKCVIRTHHFRHYPCLKRRTIFQRAFRLDPFYATLFFEILSLCHSVCTEKLKDENNEVETIYQAQYPDETAFLEIAQKNGFSFHSRSGTSVNVLRNDLESDIRYEIPVSCEFTSERRRMSVVVKYPRELDKKTPLRLLVKGADNVIFERLSPEDDHRKIHFVQQKIHHYSLKGYRSLCFAYRELSKEEFKDWFERYNHSRIGPKRDRLVAELERDLILIGASAVEDRLQKEVPQTIAYFLKAGIQVWMLTGDNTETAIQIGYATKLIKKNWKVLRIETRTADATKNAIDSLRNGLIIHSPEEDEFEIECLVFKDRELVSCQNPDRNYVLVIDGTSLAFALETYCHEFLLLGRSCRSIICCRTTPIQKALTVRSFIVHEKKIACAVGDGSNDVSMIQEAHIGIGIQGKEGSQVARAADFAIQQFSHLKRLIFVHGRYCNLRITGTIQYSFYKSMTITLTFLYYSFFMGFSGQSLVDSSIILFYNMIFTSFPVIFYGTFEKDIDEEALMKYPQVSFFSSKFLSSNHISKFEYILALL